MSLPKITNPLVCGIIVAFGGVDMGFGLAYTGPTLTNIQNDLGYSKFEGTMFNVSGFLAATVGAIVINWFLPKFGKVLSCFGASIYALISWVLLAFASHKASGFIFRIMTGSTIGLYSTISPTLICDVAPADKKGFYGFMNQLGLALGFLVVNIFGGIVRWNYLALICAIPALVQTVGILFVPEPNVTMVKTSFSRVCQFPKQLIIALLLMFFLQFSGVNAVLSNLSTVIETANMDLSTTLVSIIATLAQVIATLVSAFVVDKLGQKICWTISSAGQMIAFLLLWAFQYFSLPAIVFLVGLFMEQLTYGIGTGPVPFTKTAELFRVEVRPTAMAIATAFQWIVGALVCYLWPTLQDAMGVAWSFFCFAVVSAVSIIFGLLVLSPSTNSDYGDSSDEANNDDTEEISRRMSHVMDIPEL